MINFSIGIFPYRTEFIIILGLFIVNVRPTAMINKMALYPSIKIDREIPDLYFSMVIHYMNLF